MLFADSVGGDAAEPFAAAVVHALRSIDERDVDLYAILTLLR
jgi:hypothetical protein